ncbi:heavy metal translocating P-type ATPase [Bythopirellula goksoeyrii]|uniref:P-type Zn(2+) transporter n=1 Tax=Bythopirellula goksoeyrii TaxID=1400387 RepID=A0A5B9QA67_9BACT|nr:heavy metal translocating P-type ATPase [Bythopirellula goksoeyrii]QEG33786.1 Silver exporting P-type ATPase [Bythopirellula goksoeyrii]
MLRLSPSYLWSLRQHLIALLSILAIVIHLLMRFGGLGPSRLVDIPLVVALIMGGVPLVIELLVKLFRAEFGSDMLAGISIVTAVLLGEYLAGTLVVLMLSGGEALEAYAVRSASSVLQALARRMPSIAHRVQDSTLEDVKLDAIVPGDSLVILPHEICPVDGEVIEGHGVMDESYLTGEPYLMSKTPGAAVLSGAVNGESALTIRATKLAVDSRYAKIMEVMQVTQQRRPQLRRLGDQLGAWYTPLAVAIAVAAWVISHEPIRFLAVLVIATPCPLLIAIPVAIIGSISLAAKRGIVVKDPVVLERIDSCRTAIFDKTGTLTYGRPHLTEKLTVDGIDQNELFKLVGSVERYSKHPLSQAIADEVRRKSISLREVSDISERPGEGLRGRVDGHTVWITSRKQLLAANPSAAEKLPPVVSGMECVVELDGKYASTYRFRDEPRKEGAEFIHHLEPKHRFDRVLLVSGDRSSEVEYLAERVGITEIHAGQSPEEKVAIVERENEHTSTMFVGDGINDAPALIAATVGVAIGQDSDVTTEAAGVVILDSSLEKVDEFMHISRRMRRIALQSAVGGMALSIVGMGFAAAGYLSPVAGAVLQEVIDVFAVLNALRVSLPPESLTDF